MTYLPITLFILIPLIFLLILYIRNVYIKELKPEKKASVPLHEFKERIQYVEEIEEDGKVSYSIKLASYPIYFCAQDLETAQKKAKALLQLWIQLAQEIVDKNNFELVKVTPEEYLNQKNKPN